VRHLDLAGALDSPDSLDGGVQQLVEGGHADRVCRAADAPSPVPAWRLRGWAR
jgi:hypothetical protein